MSGDGQTRITPAQVTLINDKSMSSKDIRKDKTELTSGWLGINEDSLPRHITRVIATKLFDNQVLWTVDI